MPVEVDGVINRQSAGDGVDADRQHRKPGIDRQVSFGGAPRDALVDANGKNCPRIRGSRHSNRRDNSEPSRPVATDTAGTTADQQPSQVEIDNTGNNLAFRVRTGATTA